MGDIVKIKAKLKVSSFLLPREICGVDLREALTGFQTLFAEHNHFLAAK